MKTRTKEIEVVGLGQACMDCLGSVDPYPEEDRKAEINELQMQCGGPASTALVTLSRLGVKTAFLGSISDDSFGVEILQGMEKEGVDVQHLKITPGYSSQFAFIAVTRNSGNRTVFWHRGSVPHLKPEDINLQPFSRAKYLHLDGLMIDASCEAARQAKDLGLRVVMDGGTMREGSKELAAQIDVLIASEGFGSSLVRAGDPQEKMLEALCRWGPEEIVITLGSKGSIGWNGKEIIRQSAFPVRVKDTTGAGDVYHGAYLFGMLQGWAMHRVMRFASAASALKCRETGARRGIPNHNQIQQLMDRFPEI
jgi:ribokinase